jgi:hypothetical protein
LAGRQAPAQLLPGNLTISTGVAMGVARMLEQQALEEPDIERGKSTVLFAFGRFCIASSKERRAMAVSVIMVLAIRR